jgi:uncharacterized protein (TIGR03435 family)
VATIGITRTGWLAVVLLAFQCMPSAQLEFDVASIKENKSLDAGGTMRLMPGGGITAQHLPARSYITIAYQLQPFQLIGAPDWTRETYYDITAKPAGSTTREQNFTMLQALLTDRFKLAFHRENRQLDGFALVRMRGDRLGPDLRPSTVDCEKAFATTPRCRGGGITSNTMKAVGVPMWSVLQLVISHVGAPVSDDTQLTGTFDVDLRWSNEVAPQDDLRSIFTALQEQLGLKLERRRVTAEVFVVDRIERPTPD